jgi:isoleucyl-tRNA synthetase
LPAVAGSYSIIFCQDHRTIPPEEIRSLANDTAVQAVESQKNEFRELGIMADWDATDSTYRTLGECSLRCTSRGRVHDPPDHDYEMRQLRIFQKMVERGKLRPPLSPPSDAICVSGLIYRHYRPVYYSPSSHSALAEAELVYKDDHVSHSAYVVFDLDLQTEDSTPGLQNLVTGQAKVQLLVWTTTPWTLTANMVRAFP